MTETPNLSSDLLARAAELAFALIRFESAAAHVMHTWSAPDAPRVGENAYIFTPSWRPVRAEDVVSFLAGLPSPALLAATTSRGVISLTLVDELSGEREVWGRKSLSNQREMLEQIASQFGLDPASRIVLEFDDESHIFSLTDLRMWADRFQGPTAWSISSLEGDPRAAARMNLIRSDGGRSWGGSCPIRQPE